MNFVTKVCDRNLQGFKRLCRLVERKLRLEQRQGSSQDSQDRRTPGFGYLRGTLPAR